MRAATVGLDPWRVLGADADDALLAGAMVDRLEANEIARAEAQANMTAYRVVEGMAALIFGA